MGRSGPGAEPPAHLWNVVGAVGAAGAMSPGAAGELVTELSSFTKFRDRVDGLLRDLKTSPAGPGRAGQDATGRDRFGGGKGEWSGADALHGSYSKAIKELEELSRLLSGRARSDMAMASVVVGCGGENRTRASA